MKNTFGPLLKKTRLSEMLTIDQLAEKTGLTTLVIEGIEDGVIFPDVSQLIKISKALGKNDGFFFLNIVRK